MWSFAAPFDPLLWVLILAATAVTSGLYLVIEAKRNQVDIRPGAKVPEKVGNILYLGYAQFTGGGGFAPETGFGKGLLLSYSFLIMLLVSAYTANLATFLIQQAVSGLDSLQDAVDQGVGVCVYDGTAPHEWLVSAYPKANIVPIASGGAWAGLADEDVACDVALGGRLNFNFALQDAGLNPECELAQVGTNSERMFTAGWMAGVDYNDRCSSLLIDVLSYWLLELETDGVIAERVAEMMGTVASQTCSGEPPEDGALDVMDMGGIFILHGIMCAACAAGYFGLQFYNAKCAGVGDALESGEEADDRPATKTDVAHINDKFAKVDARLDALVAALAGKDVAAGERLMPPPMSAAAADGSLPPITGPGAKYADAAPRATLEPIGERRVVDARAPSDSARCCAINL